MRTTTCRLTRKVIHRQRWRAEQTLKRVGNAGLGVYRCNFCHGWHLGKSWFLAANRIEQLLQERK